MALHWKLVVDCADPLPLAEFWEGALGYEVEDNSALIERLLDAGAVSKEDVTDFRGRMAWRALAAVRHPDEPVDSDTGVGLGRRVLFQTVPEPKEGKNRLHIDLHVGPEQRDAEVKRLTELGASVLRTVSAHGSELVTMTDPEGNEFDVE